MASIDINEFLQFARVGRPHGLKGAFFLKTEDRRTKWDGYKELLIETKDGFLLKKVLKSYLSGNCLALILEDFTTKDQIEVLYDKKIYVHKNQIKVKKHEFLASELNGYQVYDSQRKLLGVVTGVVSFGAQDNLQIKTHNTQKEILFPFIEPFVISVDRENKSIEIIYVTEFFDEEEIESK